MYLFCENLFVKSSFRILFDLFIFENVYIYTFPDTITAIICTANICTFVAKIYINEHQRFQRLLYLSNLAFATNYVRNTIWEMRRKEDETFFSYEIR